MTQATLACLTRLPSFLSLYITFLCILINSFIRSYCLYVSAYCILNSDVNNIKNLLYVCYMFTYTFETFMTPLKQQCDRKHEDELKMINSHMFKELNTKSND